MKNFFIINFFIILLNFILPSVVTALPEINSFSPSVGWPGTNNYDGTRVRIIGTGFNVEPSENLVFFKGDQGDLVQANVVVSFADEVLYQYSRSIGAPGNAPGELNSPQSTAVDSDGNLYVANYFNWCVEVFDNKGNYSHQLGSEIDISIVGIALDQTDRTLYICGQKSINGSFEGYVYALNPETGTIISSFSLGANINPQNIVVDELHKALYVVPQGGFVEKFSLSGQHLLSLDEPPYSGDGPWQLAYDQNTQILYMGAGRYVYKYTNDIFTDIFDTGKTTNYGIAIDHDGNVYVSFGVNHNFIFGKFKPDGQLISEFGDPSGYTTGLIGGPVITVDAYKRLYAANILYDHIEVYSPKESSEIIVTVPPTATSGPITIQTNVGENVTSNDSFTVLNSDEAVTLTEVDITQGLASYPFVTGKETVIYAKLNGLFGGSPHDGAFVRMPIQQGVEDLLRFDTFKWDFDSKKTIAYCHIPNRFHSSPGVYNFTIILDRNRNSLITADDAVIKKSFNDTGIKSGPGQTRDLNLYFVKFTKVPSEEWQEKPPFPWFDLKTFLYGMETLRRNFPLNRGRIDYKFGGGVYIESLIDGANEDDEDEIWRQSQQIFNNSQDNTNPIDRVVSLTDASLRDTGRYGFTTPVGKTVFTYFNKGHINGSRADTTWGRLLSHEMGHTYGLVSDKQINTDGKGEGHSINITLENEDTNPLTAWNSITDQLYNSSSALSIMGYAPAGLDDSYFFESEYQGREVDYHVLFNKLKRSNVSSYSSNLTIPVDTISPDSRKIVISGTINSKNNVLKKDSYLTTEKLSLTTVESSDYSIVFLNDSGQILSNEGFLPFNAIESGFDNQPQTLMFNIVRPYPDGTKKVQIRFKHEILISITPSKTPPIIRGLTVDANEFEPVKIKWKGLDMDGDSLTYSVLYSIDRGKTFTAIAVNLVLPHLVWEDSLCPGSTDAIIRVIANDGLLQTIADSSVFYLRKKDPKVVIFLSDEDSRYTEGSQIRIKGTAFDPEDGFLTGEQLTWWLNDETKLGTGSEVMIHEIKRKTPTGFIPMPLEIGIHPIRLDATDSEGNTSSAEIDIIIDQDTDRDGFSDQDEESHGGNPLDPFVRPNRHPIADAGPDITIDCTGSDYSVFTLDGSRSSDPDGDPLTYAWNGPSGVYRGAVVNSRLHFGENCFTLEVNDGSGGFADDEVCITVVDTTAPVLECPQSMTIECNSSRDPSITGFAKAVDFCDTDLDIFYTDSTKLGNCPENSVIFRDWTSIDASGNTSSCEQTITVVDSSAPVISAVFANPNSLWPPNHKMKPVSVKVDSSDNCDPEPVCKIISVVSNEPKNGKCDGNTSQDFEITGDLTLGLRAERAGCGSGREYTITVECTDDCNNSATKDVYVSVSQGKHKKTIKTKIKKVSPNNKVGHYK